MFAPLYVPKKVFLMLLLNVGNINISCFYQQLNIFGARLLLYLCSDVFFSLDFFCIYVVMIFAGLTSLVCMKSCFFRLDFFGIYVVMFQQILKTLLQVLVVFFILIVAFGLSFYIIMAGEVFIYCISISYAI